MGTRKTISGWGNYPKIEAEVEEPSFVEDLPATLAGGKTPMLARGLGRSYGDASLSDNVVSLLKCNRILAFNPEKGEIECESGVSLAQIIDFILPKGFFLPVTPGTKFVTVGGAIASDVHGKNHHVDGCFSKHLVYFNLLTGDGAVHTCSATQNTDLYYRTVGGMGLSGIIVKARFRLKKVETAYIKQDVIKCRNLSEIMAAFQKHKRATYSVAWLDASQKGNNIGRSVLMVGEHASVADLPSAAKNPLQIPQKMELNVPMDFPSFTVNPLTIKAFNTLFYAKNKNLKNAIINLDSYFYPLDALHNWNRIYGKAGFTQYQFVIPLNRSEEGIKEILQYIADNGRSSFLTVLKLFGKADEQAYLSFPKEGYTIAIDFNVNRNIQSFVDGLDDLVEKYDGRIYMTKDAFSRLGKHWLATLQGKFQPRASSLLVQRLSS